MKTVLLLTLLLSMLVSEAAHSAQPISSPLAPWNGELMQAEQGAVYVRFYLDGFRRTRSSKEITNSVFMNLRNVKTGAYYAISQAPIDSPNDPILVWKIPAGHYTVEKLSINENTGITRDWVPTRKRPVIAIRYLLLSNMGEIRLSPYLVKGLRATFKSTPNAFVNEGGKQTFMGVLDGYKGQLQKKLGGSQLMKASKSNFGTADQARTAFTMTRQISMIYQVDSSGSQQSRRLLSSTIASQDAELRRCYMDQLDLALGLRGSVNFKFQIAANNGSFQGLSYSGGSLNNPKTVECLSLSLRKIQFPIAKTLSGRLAFQFNYDDNPGRAKFP